MPNHAYYSTKQYHQNGNLYIYLNEKNEEVYATTITSQKLEEMNRFDDMIYLGEVVKYVETRTDEIIHDLTYQELNNMLDHFNR